MEYTRPQLRHERWRLPWRLRPLGRVSELPQLGQFMVFLLGSLGFDDSGNTSQKQGGSRRYKAT
jgi:hypothetical protein